MIDVNLPVVYLCEECEASTLMVLSIGRSTRVRVVALCVECAARVVYRLCEVEEVKKAVEVMQGPKGE